MRDQNKRIWSYIVPPPKSPLILDNLGITVSMKSLEGQSDLGCNNNF